jgi:hypothetical protein
MKDVLNVIENHNILWSQVKQKCQTVYWVLLFWEAYLKYLRLDLYQINSFKWINPMYLCDRRFYCVSAIYLSVFQKIDGVTSPLTSAVVGPSCVCRPTWGFYQTWWNCNSCWFRWFQVAKGCIIALILLYRVPRKPTCITFFKTRNHTKSFCFSSSLPFVAVFHLRTTRNNKTFPVFTWW